MRERLACEIQHLERFVSEHESLAFQQWIYDNYDLTDFEEVHFATGQTYLIQPWKMMFVDTRLTDFNIFPKEHGRRAPFPPLLEKIRDRVTQHIGLQFDVCVCLYYPNGQEHMGFHYDPPAFGSTNIIPSISLGTTREFQLRRKSDHTELHRFQLNDGSLFVMGEGCQDEYEHAVPAMPECTQPRFNLTFRPFGRHNNASKRLFSKP